MLLPETVAAPYHNCVKESVMRMSKENLIRQVSALGIRCILIDDISVNPIEILLLTDQKRRLCDCLRQNNLQTTEEADRERVIKVLSFNETGTAEWKKELFANGRELCDNVFVMSEEDTAAFWINYGCAYSEGENWLSDNIRNILTGRLKLSGAEELVPYLAAYLKGHRYAFSVRRAADVPQMLIRLMPGVARAELKIRIFFMKCRRKLYYKLLGRKVNRHNRRSTDGYIGYLHNSGAVAAHDCELLDKSGHSSSGCTFVKTEEDGAEFFIKGNEAPVFCGIRNEIRIQNIILQNERDTDWFLYMLEYDRNYIWIKYPYVEYETLDRYCERYSLSGGDIDGLGHFLLKILDKLYALNIVHNDLRSGNIMVITDSDNSIRDFLLIDFGGSVYRRLSPWNTGTFWGKFFAGNVCGRMRYNESIVDDAAAALVVYTECGGSASDDCAREMASRIGRIYFKC